MTPEQQMIFGAILFALCIGLVVYCNLILRGARKIAMEAQAKTESAKEEIDELRKEIASLTEWLHSTTRNPINYKIGNVSDGNGNDEVVVFALHPSSKGLTSSVVKSFPEADDRDFAIREAEELIDKLNEK